MISKALKEEMEHLRKQKETTRRLSEKLKEAREKQQHLERRVKVLEAEEVIALLKKHELTFEEGLQILSGEKENKRDQKTDT